MYSTSKRNYRGIKSFIDTTNIVITGIMVILAILSILKVYREMFFFPAIFYLGAVMNILTGVKYILDKRKVFGVISCIFGIAILAVAIYATLVYWV